MKPRRIRFQRGWISVGGVVALLYLTFSPLFHLGFHLLGGFQRIGEITYLGSSLPKTQQKKISQTHTQATAKLQRFWGVPKAKPQVVICANERQFRSICRQSEGAGCSLGTPMGTWVILLDLDTDVLAHELAHSEMIHRWGYWSTRLKIPTWLEEGIALQVDDRFVHGTDSLSRFQDFDTEWQVMTFGGRYGPALADISESQDFFHGSEAEVRLAYLTAGREVSGWWAMHGRRFIWKEVARYLDQSWWEVMTNGLTGDARVWDLKPQSLFYERELDTPRWYTSHNLGARHPGVSLDRPERSWPRSTQRQ